MSLSKQQEGIKQRFIDQRGIWDENWEAILKLNPAYLSVYINLRDASQKKQRLPPKVQEFIYIAVAASTTTIHETAVKAHISAAIKCGATADEIFEVIGLTYLVGIHTVTLGAPILIDLMEELGIEGSKSEELNAERERIRQDFIRQRGFWPETFNPLLELDPHYFEAYTDFSGLPSKTNVLEPKVREIVTCAFDAATTHLYGRGTKIHMRNALKLGATPDEIMEMLEITSLMGIDGVTSAAPILAAAASAATNGNAA
ncbi:carboxymuconolactone decarboxylase [Lophium mytilinum]|uniref:Carboxymuconolactone decarboxylase n=1 Tax=Lophium mytilinum TaxID=390894 RepID=A0A6A6QPQ7_9PEZI|nr:carboxymuconolactone decarboxylase [Lophium mytilinum]